MASDIKGHIVGVICNIKGQGWSGLMGNARRWPWIPSASEPTSYTILVHNPRLFSSDFASAR